jgi:hypothetical protein
MQRGLVQWSCVFTSHMAYVFILTWRSDSHWTWSVQVKLEIAKEAGLHVCNCIIQKVSLTHIAFTLSYYVIQNWQPKIIRWGFVKVYTLRLEWNRSIIIRSYTELCYSCKKVVPTAGTWLSLYHNYFLLFEQYYLVWIPRVVWSSAHMQDEVSVTCYIQYDQQCTHFVRITCCNPNKVCVCWSHCNDCIIMLRMEKCKKKKLSPGVRCVCVSFRNQTTHWSLH